MTTTDPKLEIVQSLTTLDVCQSEKVLSYIRTLAAQERECCEQEKRCVSKASSGPWIHARLWI